jgi:hypothetical protein
MKNFLRIQPDEWKREREIGQFSFIIKRAIIFGAILIPLILIEDFLFRPENEKFRVSAIIIPVIAISIGVSVIEWYSLESAYQKSVRKKSDKS